MVNYRRNKTGNPDDIFFITFVTRDRSPWIARNDLYEPLLDEMKRLTRILKVKYKAWAILPDHLHWLLRPGGADYSNAVSAFKRGFGAEMKRKALLGKGGRLWQDRFWEETIRDDDHLRNSIEYIHYNPVKHGLVVSPGEWRYSSFHSYVRRGIYPADWASGGAISVKGAEYDS